MVVGLMRLVPPTNHPPSAGVLWGADFRVDVHGQQLAAFHKPSGLVAGHRPRNPNVENKSPSTQNVLGVDDAGRTLHPEVRKFGPPVTGVTPIALVG